MQTLPRGALCRGDEHRPANCVQVFQERWPAYLRGVRADPPRRAYWRYICAATVAAGLLRELLPYFRTDKYRTRATLAIEFQGQKSNGRVSREATYIARQSEYYDRMRVLNIRGCTLADTQPIKPPCAPITGAL